MHSNETWQYRNACGHAGSQGIQLGEMVSIGECWCSVTCVLSSCIVVYIVCALQCVCCMCGFIAPYVEALIKHVEAYLHFTTDNVISVRLQ